MSRRAARIAAMQALFQLEINPPSEDTDAAVARAEALAAAIEHKQEKITAADEAFARSLVDGIMDRLADIDRALGEVSRSWKVRRMAVIDKNILRLAVYELRFGKRDDTTPATIINEAVEIAKQFGTDESGRFVNGLLSDVLAAD